MSKYLTKNYFYKDRKSEEIRLLIQQILYKAMHLATNATVIALVLFPLMRKMETVSNLRRFQQIESSVRKQLCDKFSEEVSLPCYDLSSSEELDCLFEFVIKYYGEEENE